MTAPQRVERLGTANPGNQMATARTIGGTVYTATRSARPFTAAAFDLDSDEVTRWWEASIEDGPWPVTGFGAQASTTHDGDVYYGVYGPGDLYRLSPGRGLAKVATFPGAWSLWGMDATAGGTIYAGSYPGSNLFRYDPDAGVVDDLGSAHPDEDWARAIAVDDDTIYVGVGGRQARLIALDLSSGDREDILPSHLRERSMVDGIVTMEDHVVASVSGRDREMPAALVLLNREDPGRHRIVERDDLVRFYGITARGDDVYVAARELYPSTVETVLYRYRLSEGKFENVLTTPVEVGCCALSTDGERVVGTDDFGTVWTYHMGTGDYHLTDLASAGLPFRQELPQSLTVRDGSPIVAGHRKLHVHDPDAGSVDTVRLPGEGKAMTVVGNRVYIAVYNQAYFVEFEPGRSEAEVVGVVEHRQTRPRTIHHHPATGLVLMGTVPGAGTIGGAVAAYDPSKGTVVVDRGVVPGQSIRRITSIGDAVYLASERRSGSGIDPGETEAEVVAWEPVEREVRWRCTPVSGASAIVDLVPVGGSLFGITAEGDQFVVDPDEGKPIAVRPISLAPDESIGTLAVADGRLYGVTDRRLYRIDHDTGSVDTVLDGLDSTWYNEPMVASDERGRLCLVDDYELVRVTPK